ncbi:hypothetical protein HNO88_001066 [Novosphingobium chloroacetimidivorans]|uniref:Uncharacterized protein n=1 Tax=Novosphingobium chloroacetimidivorans TaxID=1428314 RepID=A0A7W7K7Q0_9SPHN|nr:hypothetical protein [Novosphingobium chloroacetimidivorans]MBB4857755.1 hypothetical protein [Novosphingobium chloroacetimidivorans]
MELDAMLRTWTATASALAVLAFATPALAQGSSSDASNGNERVNQVIVYGDDPCPASAGDEITVCARKPESERYRIPEPLRGIDRPTSEAWSNKVMAYETVGRFGTDSCSPVGAGGFTGCTQAMIQRARAERANGTDVKFGELIQKEREKRLSTIDATAADEQASVEVEERAYEARRKAQDAAAQGTTKAP